MKRIEPSEFPVDFSGQPEDSLLTGFRDENVCGEGASCTVYRMRLQGLRVAVKRLKGEFVSNPAYRASYRKEFQLGQQLKHDGLPLYRAFHETQDEVCIVMEFIDGITLDDFLETEEGVEYFSSGENVERFLTRLLDVTGYLHRSGIIHCDIKPGNIMVRHSDRGVMLIDLDKSYSDGRDTTHGGTAVMSEPMEKGEAPTMAKDLTAIGNVVDYIADRTPEFPGRRFRRFREVCRNPVVTEDSLRSSLQRQAGSRLWMAGLTSLCVAAVCFYYFLNSGGEEYEEIQQPPLNAVVNDTVRIIEAVPETVVRLIRQDVPQSQAVVEINDFDERMSEFIQQTSNALSILRRGGISDREIRDLMNTGVQSYTKRYGELLRIYKSENPDVAGVDVELAVARVSERSEATRLWHQLSQETGDSLRQRRGSID